jgi:GNAT superfamily N-acetyltransferase
VTLRVVALDEGALAAFRGLFEASHAPCFCRYWHFVGTKNEWLDRSAFRPEESFAEMAADVQARAAGASGLLALEATASGERAVGWMKLVPRFALPKLRSLPVYRHLDLGDERATYSIGCFLVAPEARRKGVARALVEAAPRFVRAWGGKAIEAYPRRSEVPLHDEEAWQGPEALYRSLGFAVVHDEAPYPVMRLTL